MPKIKFPQDIFDDIHENGWIKEAGVKSLMCAVGSDLQTKINLLV